jgi:hypothetical protein
MKQLPNRAAQLLPLTISALRGGRPVTELASLEAAVSLPAVRI